MDTSEHNFLALACQGRTHIGKYLRNSSAASWSSRDGRHTKGTVVVAAILDLNESTRAQPGARNRLALNELKVKYLSGSIQYMGYQVIFIFVRDDMADAGEIYDRFWIQGAPASCCHDLSWT